MNTQVLVEAIHDSTVLQELAALLMSDYAVTLVLDKDCYTVVALRHGEVVETATEKTMRNAIGELSLYVFKRPRRKLTPLVRERTPRVQKEQDLE